MVKDGDENQDTIIKMRGLPWSATVGDIIKFLEGTKIKNGEAGVHITMSREGRPSGEAYIELESPDDVEKALSKDKQHMGHRYIENIQNEHGPYQLCSFEGGCDSNQ